MPLISAFILGLVQGLTEFLPVSSSGHLVIASHLLKYQSPGLILETVVHIGTTLAVIIYFRRRFASVIVGIFHDSYSRKLVFMLGLSFCTTALIGIGLDQSGIIDVVFDSPVFVGVMLLVTAGALFSVLRLRPPEESGPRSPVPRSEISRLEISRLEISWKLALLVGLAQGVAIFPGISRSGFTIVAGLWGGMGRRSAAEFSFLLSVPTILAASLFELWREPDLAIGDGRALVAAGVVSFIIGLAAIHWLIRWLQRGRLWWFGGYCAVIGAGSIVYWGLL
jgi:undecaprenyl-diphosphatase